MREFVKNLQIDEIGGHAGAWPSKGLVSGRRLWRVALPRDRFQWGPPVLYRSGYRAAGRRALVLLVALCFLSPVGFADTNSVDRGLSWLAARQRADGSWSANVALNSLPLLAFLSAGHVPGNAPHGPAIERGLAFVLSQQSDDGAFTAGGGMMYGHGIATLLLAECVGMTRQDARVRVALEKAVRLTLRSQAVEKSEIHAGGWRYEPNSTDSDLSITVWQLMALKAASDAGVAVPRRAIDDALAYLRRCEHPRGGFGYQPGGLPNESRTASALVMLTLCGVGNDPAVERSRIWLQSHPLRWPNPYFYYAAHYGAHAGAGKAEPALVARQDPDGSWSAPSNSAEQIQGGPLYCTSMAILSLTATNHFLPVYLY